MADETSAARPPPPPPAEESLKLERRGGWRRNWIGWALAAFILASCLLFVDVGQVLKELRRLDPGEIVTLLLISSADRLLMGYKWALLLRMVGVCTPTAKVIRYFYQGSFTGVFLPTHIGGDILRAWWVMRDSGIKHPVFASLVVERMLGLASAINWAIVGGAVFLAHLQPDRTVLWGLAGLLGVVAANALFAVFLIPSVHAPVLRMLRARRRSRLVAALHDFYEALASFGSDPRGLAINWLLTILEHGLQMLLYLGIAISIDTEVPPIPFLAATAVFTLVLRLPIAPDGWGVGELTAIGLYGLIGVMAAKAFTLSAIGHLIPMVALTPGFLFLITNGRDGAGSPAGRELSR